MKGLFTYTTSLAIVPLLNSTTDRNKLQYHTDGPLTKILEKSLNVGI